MDFQEMKSQTKKIKGQEVPNQNVIDVYNSFFKSLSKHSYFNVQFKNSKLEWFIKLNR